MTLTLAHSEVGAVDEADPRQDVSQESGYTEVSRLIELIPELYA